MNIPKLVFTPMLLISVLKNLILNPVAETIQEFRSKVKAQLGLFNIASVLAVVDVAAVDVDVDVFTHAPVREKVPSSSAHKVVQK